MLQLAWDHSLSKWMLTFWANSKRCLFCFALGHDFSYTYIFFAMGSAENLLHSTGKVQAYKNCSTKHVGMSHTNIR